MADLLNDQQKTQLADLFDEAQRTGDSASMSRIRGALQADRDAQARNPAFSGTNQYFDFGSMSIKERPNNGLDRFVMGMGQRFSQAADAVRQMATGPSNVYDPETGTVVKNPAAEQIKADIAERAQLDKPLNATTGGKVGNMAGTASIAMLGGEGLAGAAAGGAIAGASTPTQGDESRLANTAEGAAGGAIGYGVGRAVGAGASYLLQPIKNALGSRMDAAVQLLKAHGVDLDLFQQTGSRVAQTVRNAAEDAPLIGPSGFTQQQKQQFTQAALREMGVSGADDASAPVMAAGRAALKKTYNAIEGRSSIAYDPNDLQDPLRQQLAAILQRARDGLTDENFAVISRQVKSLNGLAAQGNGRISGQQLQNWQEALAAADRSNGKAPFLSDLRRTLNATLAQHNPQEAALLAQTDQRYAAMKAIQKAIGEDDLISPSALFNAMDTAGGKGINQNATVFGGGSNQRLVQLAQAGKLVLGRMNQTNNSGTFRRAAGTALLAGAGGALGYGADSSRSGSGSTEHWVAAIAAAVGGPALARTVVQNPQAANALASWARNQGITTAADLTRYVAGRAGGAAGAIAGTSPGTPQPPQQAPQ